MGCIADGANHPDVVTSRALGLAFAALPGLNHPWDYRS